MNFQIIITLFFSFWQIVTEWSLDETKKNCPPELNIYTVNQNLNFHLDIAWEIRPIFYSIWSKDPFKKNQF